MNGTPVAVAANCKAVGAGSVPLFESLRYCNEFIIGSRNFQSLFFKCAFIVCEVVNFEAERQTELCTGANRMAGNAVPLQGIDCGLNEIFKIIARESLVQIRGEVFYIACCGVISQLVRAGHEKVDGAGAAGECC